jgi:PKD repeat protein
MRFKMEKHENNLDKLLKAELEKEAGEIMEEMDSDESLQDISFPEDLDEKMWSKIQKYEEQQKAYEKLSDADKEAIRLGREVQALRGGENTKDHLKKDVESDSYIDNVVPIEYVKHETDNKSSNDGTNGETEKEAGKKKVKKRKRHWKVYGIVAIVAVLAMMWSMVSIGGTPFFGRVLNDIIGDREMVKVNTEREDGDKNKIDNYDEERVYEEIKDKFGMDVVRLKRNSVGMSLVQSDIDEVLKKVCLLYEDDDTLIQYQMEIQSENKSYAYDIEDKKVKRTQITVDGNKIDIIQYELDDGNEENVAQFAYEDVFYTINTTMEEADFKELLKNLYFF